MTEPALLTTPLDALHRELGARLVPFAGYAMPVHYSTGILKEHLHTRTAAGLFDVSHMGQIKLLGAEAKAALERLMPMNIQNLPPGRQRYALLTNDQGGIRDDLMVSHYGDFLLVVVNAACKVEDTAYLRTQLADACTLEVLEDRALLALQGPLAATVLTRLAPQVADLTFMDVAHITIAGSECWVSRSGYTGEDGFEISLPADHAEDLARHLLAEDEVAPIGLGARDSLRLEAGLCLYGHDIDASTTPVEANLSWAIQKIRRQRGERAGGFPGAEIILNQLEQGVARQRVGLQVLGRAPIREGAELTDTTGHVVGRVTSGGFAPSVGKPVAMGYVASASAAPGTELQALVRSKPVPVEVSPLPFVPHRYYRG